MPKPPEPTIPVRALARAERDLEWWYGIRHGALGLRAAALESGSHAWQGDVIQTADAGAFMVQASIIRLASKQCRASVQRWHRVSRTLREMQSSHMRLAAELYQPRNASFFLRALFPAAPWGDAQVSREGGDLSLVGLIPHTAAFRQAYSAVTTDRDVKFTVESWEGRAVACNARVRRGDHEMSPIEWLDYVVRPRVVAGKEVNRNPPRWTKTARLEAEHAREGIVRAYAEVRFRAFGRGDASA